MQYDVHPNPIGRDRKGRPFVAVLHSNFAELGPDWIVAPLTQATKQDAPKDRMVPIVEVDGEIYRLLVPLLTGVPKRTLPKPVGSIAAYRSRIVDALDWLFLGI